jgi:hypothetical protein
MLTPPTSPGLEWIDATDAPGSARWFRAFLVSRGLAMVPGSEVARSFERYEDWGRIVAGLAPSRTTRRRAVELAADGIGWDCLIRAIHRGGAKVFDQFDPSLRRVFRSRDVLFTRAAHRQSPVRDLVFELFVAATCSAFGADVEKAEPDVVCVFNGEHRSLACKNIYSRAKSRQEDLMVEGAKQVQRELVERGYVVANLALILPHEAFFPPQGPARFTTSEAFKNEIARWAFAFGNGLFSNPAFARRVWVDSKSSQPRGRLRGVIFCAPTIADVAGETANVFWVQIIPTPANDVRDHEFELALHRAFQDVQKHRIPTSEMPP